MNQAVIQGRIAREDLARGTSWQLKREPGRYLLRAPGSGVVIEKALVYPDFFIERRPEGGFLFGLREPGLELSGRLSLDDEYLLGEIDLVGSRLLFRSDALSALPLYWTVLDSIFYFSSDQMQLLSLSRHSGKFDLAALAEFILLKDRYNQQTIFDGVFVLTEREQLAWDGYKIKSVLPPPRPILPRREIEDESAVEEFGRLLRRAAERQLTLLAGVKIGAELSGGLDSSTVAHALIQAGAELPLLTFSKILPPPQRSDQLRRLTEFVQKFDCQMVPTELAGLYPFADLGEELDLTDLFDPTLEPYRLGVREMTKRAQSQRIKVIFTGMGGDELFENVRSQDSGFQGELEWEVRQKWLIPDYLTDGMRELFLDREHIFEPQPIPFLVHSVLQAHQVRNPFFLEQGIWPISLLADSALVTFCRRLPLRLLKGKQLIRLYQKREGFPQSFYETEQKDSMYPVYEKAVKRKRENLITGLFQASRLAEMGLVDKEKLLSAWGTYLGSEGRSREYFYELAVLELFLKSFQQHGSRENPDLAKSRVATDAR